MPTINGTPGNDTLSTSTSGDYIDAGAGNDQVTVVSMVSADGGAGDDLVVADLHADPRNESFHFSDGAAFPYSYLSGQISGYYLSNFESFHVITGTGNDMGYFYPSLTTSVWGPDSWDAGAGTDTLVVDMSGTASNITAGYVNATTYQVTGPSSQVLMSAINVESLVIISGNAATITLSGGAGDDQLVSHAQNGILNGGDGNDNLTAYRNGTIDGGDGFDTASTDLLPAYLSPIGETVTFNADGTYTVTDPYRTIVLKNVERLNMYGVAMLLGTVGDDTVTLPDGTGYMGGSGNDTITVAGYGERLIDGGTGDDTALFSLSPASYTLGKNSNGDTTVIEKGVYPNYVTTLVNVETVKFNGVATKIGGSGNDSLTGTSSDDVLFGAGGNDTLDGGGGNDTAAFSGSYNDSVLTFNSDGSVTVTGQDGTDTLRNIENVSFSDAGTQLGTIGNDSVALNGFGTPLPGSVIPGFSGGPGNDTVTANAGPIFFDGGAGTDTFFLPFDYYNYYFNGYTPSPGYPDQSYATQIGYARLLNVEIVQFNNATATLSNGHLTFTAAQPILNNSYGSVFINNVGSPQTVDSNITLTNIGSSPMTGAVIKIASGFVAGDVLTANLTGTNISASYDAATGTLTLSGADTAAHYQQALRSVQMTANTTFYNHPYSGSITWQVTNGDASHNVSALVTTNLWLPTTYIDPAQEMEPVFISGVYPGGTIAPVSFATWTGSYGALAQYDQQYSDAAKWGNNTPGTAGGTVSYYFDAASGWTATEQSVIGAGMALWSAVANINFAVTASAAGAGIIFVRGDDGGAYTTHSVTAGDANVGSIGSADMSQFAGAVISIDTSIPSFGPIGDLGAYGGYVVGTLVHEEGHALGLGHAGPYNGAEANLNFAQKGGYDSMLWSLMSYIDPQDTHSSYYYSYSTKGTDWGTTTESTGTFGNTPTTPMALDILAAQLLYGAPVTSPLSGGQVFGFNTNITGSIRPFFDFTQNTNPIVTLWDMGTNNTLDLSGFSTNSTVNLNPGTFSSCDGLINNICIAFDTKIDTFVGGAGNDTVTANNNGDTLFGGEGNDLLTGGLGNDLLDGGAGFDTAVYSGNRAAYTLTTNLDGSVTVAGAQGTDTLRHLERVQFSDQAVALTNNSAPPGISISNASVTEGGVLHFSVTLDNVAAQNIALLYDTFLATASMADNDYLGGQRTLTILAGQSTGTIDVQTVRDSKFEPDETMSVHLLTASLGNITQGVGIGTIVNDDVGPPNITIGTASVTEGGVLHFSVTLDKVAPKSIGLSYDTFAGTASMADNDYLGGRGTLTILTGQIAGTINIQTVQDSKFESDETMSVHLLTTSFGSITQSVGTGTIVNDDAAPVVPNISIGNVSITEGGVLHFGVTLNQATSQNITLSYDTFAGTASMADNDYLGGMGTLTILAGQTTGTIDIQTVQDSRVEPDETMSVHLLAASLGNITQGTGNGTIVNDDAAPVVPNISIGNASVTEGGVLHFGVTLNQATSQNITLSYDTFAGTASMADNDYLGGVGTLTILAGQTTGTIDIQTVQDSRVEPDETMSVHLLTASLGNITQDTGNGTIVNDDAAPVVPNISIGNASVTEGGVLHFGVTLNQATSQNITLSYDTFAGTASMADNDYLGGVGTLTILAGQTTGTIDIQTVQDSRVEPDETMSVHLLTASLGNITQDTGNGTIVNDDAAPIVPNISIGNASVTEGGVLHFGVTLNQATSQNITLSYDTFAGTASMADNDYLGGVGTLTILAGQTTGTIDIQTVQDPRVEPDETMSVHLLTASLGNITQGTGNGTIVAPAVPNISIGNASVTEGSVLHFGVTLNQATSQNITLAYDTFFGTASMANNDYLGGVGFLIILSGQTTGTIDIPTVQDGQAEPDETMSVHLLGSSFGNITQGTGTGTILSNSSRPEPSMTPIFGAHLDSFATSLVGMS